LSVRGIQHTEADVRACLNCNANMAWNYARFILSTTIVAPFVGKVDGRKHHCHIVSVKSGKFTCIDPDKGRTLQVGSDYFEYCYE
jgi:hypothetical protein